MYGFGGTILFDESHPLTALLSHSDCDGEIKWENCLLIGNALEELIKTCPDDDYFIDKTESFIKGCFLAYSLQENIEFG